MRNLSNLYVDGVVGIGTTSPAVKLDVFGLNNTSIFNVRQSAGILSQIESDNGYANLFLYQAGGNPKIGLVSNGSSFFNGGNVGIGTASPAYKLDVNGTFRSNALWTDGSANAYWGNGGTPTAYGLLTWDTSLAKVIATSGNRLDLGANGSTFATIATSGNVGIGTTSPGYKLEVVSNASLVARFNGSAVPASSATEIDVLGPQSNGELNLGVGGSTISDSTNNIQNKGFITAGSGLDGLNLRSDAGFVQITAGGITPANEVARFTAGGNVGIGTVAPSDKLVVNSSNSRVATFSTSNTAQTVYFGSSAQSQYSDIILQANNGQAELFRNGSGYSLYGGVSALNIWNSNGAIAFHPNNVSNVMYLSTGGNVGIGTTNPTSNLQVFSETDTTSESSMAVFGSKNTGYMALSIGVNLAGSYTYIQSTKWATNYDDLALNPNGGNVGIGTTNPLWKLHVEGNSLTLNTEGNYVAKTLYFRYSNGAAVNSDSYLTFGTGGSPVERMRINSSGNVGIGTTNPSYNLDVQGTTNGIIRAYGGSIGRLSLQNSTRHYSLSVQGSSFYLYDEVGAATRMLIDSSGNVGIGTTTPDSIFEIENSPAAQSQSRMLSLDNNPVSNQGSGYIEISSGSNNQAKTQIEQVSSGGYGLLGNQYIDTNIINRGLSASPHGNINFATGASTSATSIVMTIGGGSQKGNVGIGTTSPAAKLDVSGTALFGNTSSGWYVAPSNVHIGGTGTAQLSFEDVGISTAAIALKSSAMYFGHQSTNVDYVFKYGNTYNGNYATSGTAFAVISNGGNTYFNGGNVGIGTTSPIAPLTVLSASTGYSADSQIKISDGSTSYYGGLSFDDAGSTRLSIRNSYDGVGSIIGFGFGSSADKVQIIDGTGLIVNEGNVGIGTASPSQKLEANESSNGDVAIQVTNSNTGILATAQFFASNGTTKSQFFHTGTSFSGTGVVNYTGIGGIYNNSTGIALSAAGASGIILFGTGTSQTERMRITSAGNVGIGTTSPTNLLTVGSTSGGGIAITTNQAAGSSGSPLYTNLYFRGYADEVRARIYSYDSAVSNNDAMLIFATAPGGVESEKMRITSSGNVGIGTTSPSKKLHVYTADNEGIFLQGTGTGVWMDMQANTANIHSIGAQSGGMGIYNRTVGSYRMFITDGGNVGIGTTSPATTLDVNGTISSGGSPIAWFSGNYNRLYRPNGTVGIYLGNATDAGNYYDNTTHYFRNSGGSSNYAIISSSGNLLLGTSTDSGYRLDVAGDIHTTNSLRFSTASAPTTTTARIFFGQNISPTGTLNGAQNNFDGYGVDGYGIILQSGYGTADMGGIKITDDGVMIFGASDENVLTVIDEDSNTVVFNIGNTGAAYFSGNVGIGTDSTVANSLINVAGGINTTTGVIGCNTSDSFTFNGKTQPHYGFNLSPAAGVPIGISGYFGINFATNGTERLRIDYTGNVGIGTSSPSQKLHVVGDARIEGNLTINGTVTQIDTNTSTTEQWLVTNDGTGPAVIINQTGSQPIIDIQDDGTSAFYIEDGGNVGLGTTNPDARLDVIPLNYKVIKLGNDITSHYTFNGQTNHTLTLTSPSYYQAEVVITAHQTNSGGYNNLYIRGIWSNNHTSHHWDVLEEVGYLTGSTFTITNGQNDVENSGKLEIVHNYNQAGSSFSLLTVRVTDMYGTHSYAIS